MSSRRWCFTLNNPEFEEVEVHDMFEAKFSAVALEYGENGTPHLQGYLEFAVTRRFASLKKVCYEAHYAVAKGTAEDNVQYCSKSGAAIISGVKGPGQGVRSDIVGFTQSIKRKLDDEALIDAHGSLCAKYPRYISFVRMAGRPPNRAVELTLLFGRTGCGKTRYVMDLYPDAWELPIGKDLWFDGYTGQETVLLDDFNGQYPLVQLLRLLDRYARRVPIKGGYTWWTPTRIFVTAMSRPGTWYTYDDRAEEKAALRRRFTKYVTFHPPLVEGRLQAVAATDEEIEIMWA